MVWRPQGDSNPGTGLSRYDGLANRWTAVPALDGWSGLAPVSPGRRVAYLPFRAASNALRFGWLFQIRVPIGCQLGVDHDLLRVAPAAPASRVEIGPDDGALAKGV